MHKLFMSGVIVAVTHAVRSVCWIAALLVAACDWWAEVYLQNEEKWICTLSFLSLQYFIHFLLFYSY